MDWKEVGTWLKDNAGKGAALVGALLTGNIPAAVASGVSLVTSATGESSPEKVLESLQTSPENLVRLRELAVEDEENIRKHIRELAELEYSDAQSRHHETQETIRQGDQSSDEYVRRTRPRMARQSFYVGSGYVCVMEFLMNAFDVGMGASLELAGLLFSPALTYLGLRTWDKFKGKQ